MLLQRKALLFPPPPSRCAYVSGTPRTVSDQWCCTSLRTTSTFRLIAITDLGDHEHEAEVVHAVAPLRLPLEGFVSKEAFQFRLHARVAAVNKHLQVRGTNGKGLQRR